MLGRVEWHAVALVDGLCGVCVPAVDLSARSALDIDSDALRKTLHTGIAAVPLWALRSLFAQPETNMVTQDSARDSTEERQLLRESDLRRLRFASSYMLRSAIASGAETKALARLAQTIARHDRALEDQILRCWGIR